MLQRRIDDGVNARGSPPSLKFNAMTNARLTINCGFDFHNVNKITYQMLQHACTLKGSLWEMCDDPVRFTALERQIQRDGANSATSPRRMRTLRIDDMLALHRHVRRNVVLDSPHCTTGKFQSLS